MTNFHRFILPITASCLLSYWAVSTAAANLLPTSIKKSNSSEQSAKLTQDNSKTSVASESAFKTEYWSNLPDKL